MSKKRKAIQKAKAKRIITGFMGEGQSNYAKKKRNAKKGIYSKNSPFYNKEGEK